jgi:hypothetical protein
MALPPTRRGGAAGGQIDRGNATYRKETAQWRRVTCRPRTQRLLHNKRPLSYLWRVGVMALDTALFH